MATTRTTGQQIKDLTITDADVAAANKDGLAATPSLRTLGTGSTQAAAGNHVHSAADITSGILVVARGGTGGGSFTAHGLLVGNGTSQVGVVGVGTGGQVLLGQNSADPTWNDLSGDVTVNTTGVTAIGANKVTTAMLGQIATASFLGRVTAATGNVEVLTVAAAKSLLGLTGTNSGDQTITLTGDVTGGGTGSFAATIAAASVTYAKIQDVAGLSVVGRSANSSGVSAAITGTDGQVLRVSGTTLGFGTVVTAGIADGAVTEAKQTLADNTTGDLATTRHGYAPKAPNDATKFLDGTAAWSQPHSMRWLFGDGSDGDATISTTTLTRSMYYNNLTINTGQALNTAGFRVHVAGTLTLSGTAVINANGAGGGTSTVGGVGLSAGELGGSGSGGTGATGVVGVGAVGGAPPTLAVGFLAANVANTGGAGGAGTSGAGGAGAPIGTVTLLRPQRALGLALSTFDGTGTVPVSGGQGGGGGGSGAGDGVRTGGNGGGGGSGGGIIAVFAKTITFGGAGAIRANGGAGKTGGNGGASGNAGGGGGGGGGQGGVVLLAYETLTLGTGTITASGGAGGAGGTKTGTGVDGSTGTTGSAGAVLRFNCLSQAWE